MLNTRRVVSHGCVTEVLFAKYDERPRITARLMDAEFFRIEACLMAGERNSVAIRAELDRRFERHLLESLHTALGLRPRVQWQRGAVL